MSKIDVQKIDKFMSINEVNSNGIVWWNPIKEDKFSLYGFPWISKDKVYKRLPLNSIYKVSKEVDLLSNCTSGGQIKFKTDSSHIFIRVKLMGLADMNHMPATGQCGFDCYVAMDDGKMYYCNTTKYDHTKDEYEYELYRSDKRKLKEVLINFPLYQGVKEVEIGLDNDCKIVKSDEMKHKNKIVFYGTSITQGGCASRPGMSYTNILSRKLQVECVNLGFSGNGKGEPELSYIISDINNIGCLVLDYEGNCVSYELFSETLPNFIKIFRKYHKNVPILLISRIPSSFDLFLEYILQERVKINAMQRKLVKDLNTQGDKNIYFLDLTSELENDFYDCTVDGIHPTDYGFALMAEKIYPVIKELVD